MYQERSQAGQILSRAVAKAIAALADACRSAMAIEGDRYHPEAHYMRGPGPKLRAKQASANSELGLIP
jgi:hypothetical protein